VDAGYDAGPPEVDAGPVDAGYDAGPTLCTSDADCDGAEVCLIDLSALTADAGPAPDAGVDAGDADAGDVDAGRADAGTAPALSGICGAAIGDGAAGEVCDVNADCASGLCATDWPDDVCGSLCDEQADCDPLGLLCLPRDVDGVTLDLCVPARPDTCTRNGDCAGNARCRIVVDDTGASLTSVCLAPAGAGVVGTDCTDDGDCESGLCLADHCAAPCADRGDCGGGQTCREETVDVDGRTGDYDVCFTLPDTVCDENADCEAERVCGDIGFGEVPFEVMCQFPGTGGAELGDSCSGSGNSSECTDGICLGPYNGMCTRMCIDDGDCTDGGAFAGDFGCTEVIWTGNGNLRHCVDMCAREDDCPNDQDCTLSWDGSDDAWEFVCRIPRNNSVPLGGDCMPGGNNCASGLCAGNKCTTTCSAPADCDTPFDGCAPVNVSKPSSGSQSIDVCVVN
jgi:hypothetical protein